MGNHGLRFIGNLILTRLLFPEAFGLMAIVQTVLMGITMMSDVGIGASIIRHKRGEESVFLNTGWTIQVIRGFAIYLVVILITIPLAKFYDQPLLNQLLPVIGLTAILNGFISTHVQLAVRRMKLSRVIYLEVGSYALGLSITIFLAWLEGTVWALVWGSLASSTIKTALSHILFREHRNSFSWDRESRKEMFSFGRWVMVSTFVTFLSGEGNKLIVGKLIGLEHLAFFTIASTLNQLFQQILWKISDKALFPAYSKLNRENPEALYKALFKSRLIQIAPSLIVSVSFVFLGNLLIETLYDPRYAQAGWMLQILAMGPLVNVLTTSNRGILYAKGMASTTAYLITTQVVIHMSLMFVGYYFFGILGVIMSFPATGWAMYPVHAWVYKKLSLWQPEIDIPVLIFSMCIVGYVFTNAPLLELQ